MSALRHVILIDTSFSILSRSNFIPKTFILRWSQFQFVFFFPGPQLFSPGSVVRVSGNLSAWPSVNTLEAADWSQVLWGLGSSLFANSPEWDGWQSETLRRSTMFCFTANNTDRSLDKMCAGDSQWLAMRTLLPSLNTEPLLGCIWLIVFGCQLSCTPKLTIVCLHTVNMFPWFHWKLFQLNLNSS